MARRDNDPLFLGGVVLIFGLGIALAMEISGYHTPLSPWLGYLLP